MSCLQSGESSVYGAEAPHRHRAGLPMHSIYNNLCELSTMLYVRLIVSSCLLILTTFGGSRPSRSCCPTLRVVGGVSGVGAVSESRSATGVQNVNVFAHYR